MSNGVSQIPVQIEIEDQPGRPPPLDSRISRCAREFRNLAKRLMVSADHAHNSPALAEVRHAARSVFVPANSSIERRAGRVASTSFHSSS